VKALLIAALASALLGARPPVEHLPDPANATHMVACQVDAKVWAIETSWYADKHIAITAAHVVASNRCQIEGERALVVYKNDAVDIAVLWTPAEGEGRIPIRCGKPRKGEVFHVYGYPNAEPEQKRFFVSKGTFADDPEFPGMAVFDGAGTGGQSGSAVLDSKGYAIGLLNASNNEEMLSRLLRETYLCGAA
jgi:V8-like Glu-specific endopeptidase